MNEISQSRDTGARSWRRRAVSLVAVSLASLALMWASASPASAHAELAGTTPGDGTRLDRAPAQVTLRFTEDVNLIDGGLRLVDGRGSTVPTPSPTVSGSTIRWKMPARLPNGAYLVDWRVISVDGHPVAGAFAFGVGAEAPPVGPVAGGGTSTAPWPVVVVRLAGYLAFALLVGVVGFVTWCSPVSRRSSTLQLLARVALVGGVLSTLAGLLVQGPYVAGTGWARLLDPILVQQTAATPFGRALVWRLLLYALLFLAVWVLEWLEPLVVRWLVGAGLVATAVTFAASGHGAASGRLLDLGVVTVHVLAAGTWLGGLLVLTVVGRAVERRAVQQFSRLAMGSVLVLVASGTVNSLLHVHSVVQLFGTRYGLLLTTKVLLVAGALLAAAVSRSRLRADVSPVGSVRVEAAVTVVVLAVTAALSLTSPPPTLAAPADPSATAGAGTGVTQTLPLGTKGFALVNVVPPRTTGSTVRVGVTDPQGQLVPARRVQLRVSLPAQGIDAIEVPLRRSGRVWAGTYRFPLPGTWKLTLTVEDRSLAALVTATDVSITR